MRKTNKLIMALVGTVLAGSLTGCAADERVVYQQPGPPPHLEGYDDRYWEWEEEDGEWEYNPPGGGGGHYFYHGGLHKSSIQKSGLKSTAPKITTSKSIFSGKLGGFGSGSRGGSYGG